MNLNVHIERLVLEGLPVTPAQSARVLAAVQNELAQALAEPRKHPTPVGGTQHRAVHTIHLAPGGSPALLGRQIARAVHAALPPGATKLPAPVSSGGTVA